MACGLATFKGEPVITSDVRTDERWKDLRWLAEEYGYRGCWSFPLQSSVRQVLGTIAFYFREPRAATERDKEAAELLARTAAIIISSTQEAEDNARAEAALRESEQRFRLFVENVREYPMEDDWVFASLASSGKLPYWSFSIFRTYVKPALKEAKITSKVGWHTFRHSFATILKAHGEDVKTVQELMRHANSSVTLNLYAQAVTDIKRTAQSKVARLVFTANGPTEE